eukprot:1078263-Prorocentrum_minimum.AAC.2
MVPQRPEHDRPHGHAALPNLRRVARRGGPPRAPPGEDRADPRQLGASWCRHVDEELVQLSERLQRPKQGSPARLRQRRQRRPLRAHLQRTNGVREGGLYPCRGPMV